MFSLSQRFQTVSNTAMSVGMFMAVFIVITSWFQLQYSHAFESTAIIANLNPRLNKRNNRFYGSTNGKPKENIRVDFDLETDLTKLFNWNTKQIFIYLTAEYNNTKNNVINEVTFWDKIITSVDDANLDLKKVKSKYSVWDPSENLSGKDLRFKLNWNIQPWVGPLIFGEIEDIGHLSIRKESSHSKAGTKKNKNREAVNENSKE